MTAGVGEGEGGEGGGGGVGRGGQRAEKTRLTRKGGESRAAERKHGPAGVIDGDFREQPIVLLF